MFSHLPSFEELFKNQQKLIPKLGIAQRQIRLKFSHNPRKWQTSSPTSIQTIGDLIWVKRRERNLTRYHFPAAAA
jgi:hypothetical protein